jgi:hypothetical protein
MAYVANVFNVMIASPSDVQLERNIAREVIHEWNAVHSMSTKLILQPVGWESHSQPSMGDRPQAIINKQVLSCSDLLIAIFWTRLGTPTGQAPSGTVEEIDVDLKQGKPAMLYFSSAPVRADSVDEDQYRALKEFRKDCEQRGLVQPFDDSNDFRQKFARQLAATINTHVHFKVAGNPSVDFGSRFEQRVRIPQISKEAAELLKQASNDGDGYVIRARHLNGVNVSTNGRDFVEQNNPRSTAVWEAAVDELASARLIKDTGSDGQIYKVTREGYEFAELLSAPKA